MNKLTKVVLVGSLGKAMSLSEWHLDVKSPAEAIRAININTRGKLEEYLTGPARNRYYRVALQKRDNAIDREELSHRSGRSTIYIIPTVRGRNSGVGKILVGIALIAAAIYFGPAAFSVGGWGGTGAVGAGIATAAIGFGVSMVLGGISQLLTPRPQGSNASPEQAQSTSFPGNATAVTQGSPIPIVYGHVFVSPLPVAITTTNNDVSTSAAGTLGGVQTTNLPGGGQQNEPVPTLD